MTGKFLLLAPVVLLACAQVLLKRQASLMDEPSVEAIRYLGRLLLAPGFWLAMLLAGGGLVAWMLLLRRYPLSEAYPIISLTFPLVAALSLLVLGERITVLQMLGYGLIVAGVSLVVQSGVGR